LLSTFLVGKLKTVQQNPQKLQNIAGSSCYEKELKKKLQLAWFFADWYTEWHSKK